jgi:hypothetical protein
MSSGQVEVLSGKHLVGVKHGAVVVVAHRGPSPLDRASKTMKTWSALQDLITQAFWKGRERFADAFGELVAEWIAELTDDAEFGALLPAPTGYKVVLRGDVHVIVEGHNTRRELSATGDRAVLFDDISSPLHRAALFVVDDVTSSLELPARRGIGALVAGVAEGSGAVVWVEETERVLLGQARPERRERLFSPPPPEPEDVAKTGCKLAGPEVADRPVADRVSSDVDHDANTAPAPADYRAARKPAKKVELRPPKTFDTFRPDDKPPPRRPPLPVGPKPAADAVPAKQPPRRDARPRVRGIRCAVGHLNDPRVAFCRLCGRRMHQTRVISEGERPALGFLVLDDGGVLILDGDKVLGRQPEESSSARRGAAPVRLSDPAGRLSRAHAEFRLIEWDVAVIDLGSTNGTFVKPPGQQAWQRLAPRQPFLLREGYEVLIGGRLVSFDSPHAHL